VPKRIRKNAARERGFRRFGLGSGAGAAPPAADLKPLRAKIGELTLENDS
jgi:hypothetical protein